MKEDKSVTVEVEYDVVKVKTIKLFNVPLSSSPSVPQFFLLSSLVFTFYLVYGYVLVSGN